jgi:hypothetical protein
MISLIEFGRKHGGKKEEDSDSHIKAVKRDTFLNILFQPRIAEVS